jgi:hypothetical protein
MMPLKKQMDNRLVRILAIRINNGILLWCIPILELTDRKSLFQGFSVAGVVNTVKAISVPISLLNSQNS